MRLTVSAVESRLIRALQRGGLAVLEGKGWIIYRAGDCRRRSVGKLPNAIIDDLCAKGALVNDEGDPSLLSWGDASIEIETASDGSSLKASKSSTKRARPRSLIEQAARLDKCEAGRSRLLMAANRFLAEVEQASASQFTTMRWDQTPMSRGAAKQPHMGPGEAASRAAANLRHVRQVIGDVDFAVLELVLIGDISRAGLARRTGLTPRGALRQMYAALVRLAEAYDLAVPSAC